MVKSACESGYFWTREPGLHTYLFFERVISRSLAVESPSHSTAKTLASTRPLVSYNSSHIFRVGFPGRPRAFKCDCAAINAASLIDKDSFCSCFFTVSSQFLTPALFFILPFSSARSRTLPDQRTLSSSKDATFWPWPPLVVSSPSRLHPTTTFFLSSSPLLSVHHRAR